MKKIQLNTHTEQRRLEAIVLLEQGWSGSEVAHYFGVTPAAVSHWKTAHQRHGSEALKSTPHTGRPAKLTDDQFVQLGTLLLQGPKARGYPNSLWTLSRVAAVIKKRFGIEYDASGVWHVLVRMGWSCQKPERRARERNEEAIEAWRKNDWQRIKKSPKKRKNHRFCGRKRLYASADRPPHVGPARPDADSLQLGPTGSDFGGLGDYRLAGTPAIGALF